MILQLKYSILQGDLQSVKSDLPDKGIHDYKICSNKTRDSCQNV